MQKVGEEYSQGKQELESEFSCIFVFTILIFESFECITYSKSKIEF